MSEFEQLLKLNVNDKVEERTDGKVTLKYLSWSYAWSEFKKVYPDATYEIVKFPCNNGEFLPYMHDEMTGYMVNTRVTANGLTYEMWLPVMNNANKAMKCIPYEYETKYGKKSVEQATMFDINKTIMRCLVKNLAMFGLGLYIYAGEDLPEGSEETNTSNKQTSLIDRINACTSESALQILYKENKKQITGDPVLLDAITIKGRELK